MTGFLTRLNHSAADELPDDGGNGCAPDAHGRAAQQTEDHNGVENNVDHCADDEGDHRQHRVTHGLQKPLPVGL